MRLHRFYLPQITEINTHFTISQETLLHQWTRVFRFHVGDEIIIFFGTNEEYVATFLELSNKKAVLEIKGSARAIPSPKKEMYLFAALIKKDNFEWIVEKATELGVSQIVPLLCERTEKKDVNLERLTKISVEASEQSGRGTVPHIYEPMTLGQSFTLFTEVPKFVCDFDGETLLQATEKLERVGMYIGPEGGWSDAERQLFKEQKIMSVTFGKQVLRAETAAIAVCAMCLLD